MGVVVGVVVAGLLGAIVVGDEVPVMVLLTTSVRVLGAESVDLYIPLISMATWGLGAKY